MPKRKSKLARRPKYHYVKQNKTKETSDHIFQIPLTSDIINGDCFEETETGWSIAMKNFTNTSDAAKEVTLHEETYEDSDGFFGGEFFVIWDKVYPYSPDDDLDVFLSELRASLRLKQFQQLSYSLKNCNSLFGFTLMNSKDCERIKLCQCYEEGDSIVIKNCVSIDKSCRVNVIVHRHTIAQDHDIWFGLPKLYTSVNDVFLLLEKLTNWNVCSGNYDEKFVDMVPIPSKVAKSSLAAYREGDMGASDGNIRYISTIRSVKCNLLVPINTRCRHCKLYRASLRKSHYRQTHFEHKPVDQHSKKPHVHMNKEELITKVDGLKTFSQQLATEVKKLKKGIHAAIKRKRCPAE